MEIAPGGKDAVEGPAPGGSTLRKNICVAKASALSANRLQLPPLVERKHFAQIEIHQW